MKSDSAPPIPPPVLVVALLVMAGVLAKFLPIPRIPIPMHLAFGVLFMVLGIGLGGTGIVTFKMFGTPVRPGAEPTHFVTSGPYRITRNPMYLGLLLFLIGWFFLNGSPYFLLPPVLFFLAINYAQIPFEERFMVERFGEEYKSYCNRVRRWV